MKSKPKNNFDFLRMLAATLVMVSHAFQISYGEKINNISPGNEDFAEPLLWLTRGQLTIGHLSVLVFFIISGYLITMSQERSSSSKKFLINRALRIFPGLAVAIIFTVFIVGPFATSLSFSEYFSHMDTWKYISNATMLSAGDYLPGVFGHNPLPNVVNGSLWTLKYEFGCYLLVCGLNAFGLLKKKVVIGIFIILFAEVVYARHTGHPFLYFMLFFSMGMVLRLAGNDILFRGDVSFALGIILILAALMGAALSFKVFVLVFSLVGGYIILYLAFAPWINLSGFSRYGDFSYGLYIYAFPIQQMVSYYMGSNQKWFINFSISFPLALICAFISWHWVEKRALAMKGKSMPAVAVLDVKG